MPSPSHRWTASGTFGVEEGVGDALGGDRVLVVAGIPDQCPPLAVRLAEPARHGSAEERRLSLRIRHALGEVGRQLKGLEEVALDVGFVGLRLGVGPAGDDHGLAVVCRCTREAPVGSDKGLDVVGWKATEVGVVGVLQARFGVVVLSLDGLGHVTVAAVGADDDPGLVLGSPPLRPDPDDSAVLDEELVDVVVLADLDARLGAASTRIVSSTVRRGRSRACALDGRAAPDRERAEVQRVGLDRRAAGATSRSSSPQRFSAATPGAWMMWVERVSLGNVARSTSSTR